MQFVLPEKGMTDTLDFYARHQKLSKVLVKPL